MVASTKLAFADANVVLRLIPSLHRLMHIWHWQPDFRIDGSVRFRQNCHGTMRFDVQLVVCLPYIKKRVVCNSDALRDYYYQFKVDKLLWE